MTADRKKTILISPLNWGLGHATRMIPVINVLLKQGHRVVIGAYGSSAVLLKKECRECTHVEFPGFTPKYSVSRSQTFALMLQSVSFLFNKYKEVKRTKRLVEEFNIHLIISDNRYGVRHKKVKSIIVTHQLYPALNGVFKLFEKPIAYIFYRWIKKFDECWIPDNVPIYGISGRLSENKFNLKNIKYAGLLSRFGECKPDYKKRYDYVAVISGPDPWRSRFENELIRLFIRLEGESVIVRGVPEGSEEPYLFNGITMIDNLNYNALNHLMCNSRNIICRPGYSTLMDLYAMGRRALLVPTPGQPEQEYLAEHMKQKHEFIYIKHETLLDTGTEIFNQYDKYLSPVKNHQLKKLVEKTIK